jgi:SAM-dependent methyltransferase
MWARVAKDSVKACLPFQRSLRDLVRKIRPYESLPANDTRAIELGLQLISLIRDHDVATDRVLEVGTGWIPTIPKLLKAYGARRLILTDIERFCDARTDSHAQSLAQKAIPHLALASGKEQDALQAGLLRSNVEEYRFPPELSELDPYSIDLVYSRSVLEHLPEPILKHSLAEWKRILKPGGHCIHFIDNSDHFEHRDKALSRLNFLTLSDFAWKVACLNPQNYQNRLRHSDYLRLFHDAGYDLIHVNGVVNAQVLADLPRLHVVDKFQAYEPEDLATLLTIIVAKPKALQ